MEAPLYNATILRLATAIPLQQRLERPEGSAAKRSPVCGSRVTADVMLDADGRIVMFGQEVRACALGQASAAILGGAVIGRSGGELRDAHAALTEWLSGEGPLPAILAEGWPEVSLFEPARAYPARHPSIRLAFDAAASAAEAALAARKG